MQGYIHLPGDKSISHRVAMLASVAEGPCKILNFNAGEDCQNTLRCLQILGVRTEGKLIIHPAPFQPPDRPLDCGNSGTTMRLLTGLLAGENVPATLIGDLSLVRRPMGRLAEPLRAMGAVIHLRDDEYAPVTIEEGVKRGIVYHMHVRSAQVKSAILLAGLKFSGTHVSEPVRTRDHTERLLEYLQISKNGNRVPAFEYEVPGDPSAAAFFVTAALLQDNSDIIFRNVLMNPFRAGFFRKIQQAGANVQINARRLMQNEYVADLHVRSGKHLMPIRVEPEDVPSLIDELPALAVLGTLCGLEVTGAEELRYKESDRIEAIVANMDALGIRTEERDDGFKIWPGELKSGVARTFSDHRIAMAFASAGIEVDDPDCVKISFPEFFEILQSL